MRGFREMMKSKKKQIYAAFSNSLEIRTYTYSEPFMDPKMMEVVGKYSVASVHST